MVNNGKYKTNYNVSRLVWSIWDRAKHYKEMLTINDYFYGNIGTVII